ncbi:MAG: hypothetical protein AAF251_12350 [Pseudomonadota bacterium]
MSEAIAHLNMLFEEWREPLESRALVRFEAGAVPQEPLTPAAKADAFAGQFGFKSIGFNWEMLDPSDDLTAPRSALNTIVEALSSDMVETKLEWLGTKRSLEFAVRFLKPFDPATFSVVTNHLNGLWYPISGASDEWSFATMDDQAIALLVLVPKA